MHRLRPATTQCRQGVQNFCLVSVSQGGSLVLDNSKQAMLSQEAITTALVSSAGTAVALVGLLRTGKVDWLRPKPGKEVLEPSKLRGVQYVQQPDPAWKPGKKQPHPFRNDEMFDLDPAELGSKEMYPFIISSIVPRPIAFICSVNKKGVMNLAPYSYFGVMSHDPPVVCIGTCATATTEQRSQPVKDSQYNILETGEWTLNMISEWFVESANHTCGAFDPEVDEVKLAGLTPVPSKKVKPPRIRESVVQMECRLRDTHVVKNMDGKVTSTILIGEVVLVHANKHVCTKTKNGHIIVDLAKYAPVSRCGGDTYARISEAYNISRPGKEWQERSSNVS